MCCPQPEGRHVQVDDDTSTQRVVLVELTPHVATGCTGSTSAAVWQTPLSYLSLLTTHW
jgi:hypothetical protein